MGLLRCDVGLGGAKPRPHLTWPEAKSPRPHLTWPEAKSPRPSEPESGERLVVELVVEPTRQRDTSCCLAKL